MSDREPFGLRLRRSIRLPGFDYRTAGSYFVTICTDRRAQIFADENTHLVVKQSWQAIPDHFQNAQVDSFVVMPNHVHGVLFIIEREDGTGVGSAPRLSPGVKGAAAPVVARHVSPGRAGKPGGVPPGSLGAIVGSFKATVARRINGMRGTRGEAMWQVNYYEHVIRDEDELARVRRYIEENPMRWDHDPENPERVR